MNNNCTVKDCPVCESNGRIPVGPKIKKEHFDKHNKSLRENTKIKELENVRRILL